MNSHDGFLEEALVLGDRAVYLKRRRCLAKLEAEKAPPAGSNVLTSVLFRPTPQQDCVDGFQDAGEERFEYDEKRNSFLVFVECLDLSGMFYHSSLGYVYDVHQVVSILSNYLKKGEKFRVWVKHTGCAQSVGAAFVIDQVLPLATCKLVQKAKKLFKVISAYGIVAGTELVCFKFANLSFFLGPWNRESYCPGQTVWFRAMARPGSPCYDVLEAAPKGWGRIYPTRLTKNGPAFHVRVSIWETRDHWNLYCNRDFGLISEERHARTGSSRSSDEFEAWIVENRSTTAGTRFQIVRDRDITEEASKLTFRRPSPTNWPCTSREQHTCVDGVDCGSPGLLNGLRVPASRRSGDEELLFRSLW
uniref:Spt5-NGN domain-containing protein n=1 Tax=Steinernema glaseri TaxID=37863 RepID=A0A1I7ZAN1_9BILA